MSETTDLFWIREAMDEVMAAAVSQLPGPAVASLLREENEVTELAIQGAPDGMVETAFENYKGVARELGVESEVLA